MAIKTKLPFRLYKRGEIYHAYYSFVSEKGERIQFRETTCRTSYEQAERYCIQRVAELQNKTRQQASGELPSISLDEAMGLFYQKHAQYYARPEETLRKLKLIKNNLSVKYLHEINTAELSDYIQRRKSTVSNGTINRELVIISSLLTQCRLWKYKTSEVRPNKLKLKEPAENIKYLKDWQIAQKIIDRASKHLKPIIYTALYTALRRSNILALRWEELDFINNVINVKVKDKNVVGGKNLTVPMIYKLKEILQSQPKINEYVFNFQNKPIKDIKHSWASIFYKFSQVKKEEIKKGDVFHTRTNKDDKTIYYKRFLIDPSFPYINFHTLRHTAATWILKKTNNLKITQEILGHANITTTMKYAHIMSEEKRNALNAVFGD